MINREVLVVLFHIMLLHHAEPGKASLEHMGPLLTNLAKV